MPFSMINMMVQFLNIKTRFFHLIKWKNETPGYWNEMYLICILKKVVLKSMRKNLWKSFCFCSWTNFWSAIKGTTYPIKPCTILSSLLLYQLRMTNLFFGAMQIAAEIQKSNKEAHLEAFEVDISSFRSIFHFKESLKKWLHDSDMHLSLQLLINNAGILATSPRKTAEGYDE